MAFGIKPTERLQRDYDPYATLASHIILQATKDAGVYASDARDNPTVEINPKDTKTGKAAREWLAGGPGLSYWCQIAPGASVEACKRLSSELEFA